MGCQAITYEKSFNEFFDGEMIKYGEEDKLDGLINASIKFRDIKNLHVFNAPNQERNNDTDKLFTIIISSGCLRKCTYCQIHRAHGYINSKSIEEIKKEFKIALQNGYKNIVLAGTDTSVYGYDINTNILTLIDSLLEIDNSVRLYIDNLNPMRLTEFKEGLLRLAKRNVFDYLHIPLQHVNNDVLKRMGRAADFNEIYEIIKEIKTIDPGIVLFTDVITGFPGETEEQFNELLEFVKNDECFYLNYINEYCEVESAPSSKMDNKIDSELRKARWLKLLHEYELKKPVLSEKAQKIVKRLKPRYNVHEELVEEYPKHYYFCMNSYDLINEN
jgi:ribosomal protein S12 methylthiotransferase